MAAIVRMVSRVSPVAVLTPMHSLAARVRRAAADHRLWERGMRVAVALSGGSDSVALLHLLRALAAAGDLQLAGVIHVNHQLRGDQSEADERFCRELAERLGLPAYVERIDVVAARLAAGGSLEAVARQLRYAALARGGAALGSDRIAVGHTRDDQAETVLLKLLRGAGATGLGGIYPRRDHLVRPLLGIGREELRAWLSAEGHEWREDVTNADVTLTRNRVRRELLPYLEQAFGPHIRDILARTADMMRDEAALLDDLASARVVEVVEQAGNIVSLDRAALNRLPPALGRRVARAALRLASGDRWAGLAEVETVLEVARGHRPAADLPGARVELRGAAVVLLQGGHREPAGPDGFRYELPIPGSVWIREAECLIEAALQTSGDRLSRLPSSEVVVAGIEQGWAVRSWRPGDRVGLPGLRGHKKLQDLFVDSKVPRADRGRIPLVVDARDRIVWVAGHAISEEFRVTDPTKPMVTLKLTRQSGGRF